MNHGQAGQLIVNLQYGSSSMKLCQSVTRKTVTFLLEGIRKGQVFP
jgi:hypothetical protein